jgi:hypothetical protein
MAYTRRPDLIAGSIDDEAVVLNLRTGLVHQLNATASHVWNECDGARTAAEIAARVASVFEDAPEPEQVLQDVLATITEFTRLGLLVEEPGTHSIRRIEGGVRE